MKKSILAIATIAILTIGNSFAQNKYQGKANAYPTTSYRADNAYEEYNINQLDNIVNLSRKQENQIKKIENQYDKIAVNNRRLQNLQSIKRLELQKQQDILSVLTPMQHQRLLAYEHGIKNGRNNNRSNRRG